MTRRPWQTSVACVLLSMCLGISARADDEREPDVFPTPEQSAHPHREQRDHYLWGTFGPPGLIGAALTSAFQQWRGAPREWGQTGNGYAKRFAAEYAQSSIGDTTKYMIARGLDEDPSFRPCECAGLLHRVRHASLGPISASKPDGRTVFSMARVAGLTAGEVVSSTTWYPARHGVNGVATHLAVDVAGQIGVDLLREFVLRRRRD